MNKPKTFRELFDLYLERHAMVKLKCPQNVTYWTSVHGDYWLDKQLSAITKDDVQDWVDHLGTHSQSAATRAATQLAAVFAWGSKRNYCKQNPCTGIEKFKDIKRNRFLLPGELLRLKGALKDSPLIIHDLVWLALLTSARKANLLSMRWDEIDLDLRIWEIPGNKFKNGDSHIVPLEDDAIAILRRRRANSKSPWVFPGRFGQHLQDPKRAWVKVKEKAGLKNFWFHDLRRTGGSYMAISGVSLHVIGKALGHKDPRSTEIYARLNLDAIRTAFKTMHTSLKPDQRAS